jgi:hypothetical protein
MNSITARQHDYRVGRELYQRHAPLRQCSSPATIAGWLRAYESVYGLDAARDYFAAYRELQAGVFDPYAEGEWKDEPGFSENRERSLR